MLWVRLTVVPLILLATLAMVLLTYAGITSPHLWDRGLWYPVALNLLLIPVFVWAAVQVWRNDD